MNRRYNSDKRIKAILSLLVIVGEKGSNTDSEVKNWVTDKMHCWK